MTIRFVTRHPGARKWAIQQGLAVDEFVVHLDTRIINPGDVVIGSLPVNLAADVCERGGRYLQLSLELPLALRGCELDIEQMQACGACLEEYHITRVV